MRTIFKVFIEFVTILFLFYVSVSREVSSWTKDWTCNPCTGRQCLNNWTTREASGHLAIELCFSYWFWWLLIFRIVSLNDVNTTSLGTYIANISTSLLVVLSIYLSWLCFSDLKQNFFFFSNRTFKNFCIVCGLFALFKISFANWFHEYIFPDFFSKDFTYIAFQHSDVFICGEFIFCTLCKIRVHLLLFPMCFSLAPFIGSLSGPMICNADSCK